MGVGLRCACLRACVRTYALVCSTPFGRFLFSAAWFVVVTVVFLLYKVLLLLCFSFLVVGRVFLCCSLWLLGCLCVVFFALLGCLCVVLLCFFFGLFLFVLFVRLFVLFLFCVLLVLCARYGLLSGSSFA